MLKESGWNKYTIVSTIKGVDSIMEHVLVDHQDFSDLEALTREIEQETQIFIKDIKGFLSRQ
ncbi:MAG TPA: hypothetical protein VMW28_07980 [Pelolinea sp.]|nr:hypothetical protein [Pelolinea sp.]